MSEKPLDWSDVKPGVLLKNIYYPHRPDYYLLILSIGNHYETVTGKYQVVTGMSTTHRKILSFDLEFSCWELAEREP